MSPVEMTRSASSVILSSCSLFRAVSSVLSGSSSCFFFFHRLMVESRLPPPSLLMQASTVSPGRITSSISP
uniref:Putative secreted protein n=1 Tax=Ixodes ricinus TaxID=34613 RepID=A0A6B0TU38_IXORI